MTKINQVKMSEASKAFARGFLFARNNPYAKLKDYVRLTYEDSRQIVEEVRDFKGDSDDAYEKLIVGSEKEKEETQE